MSIFLSNGLMLTQGVYDKAYPGELFQGGVNFGNITIGYLQMMIVGMTIFLLFGLNHPGVSGPRSAWPCGPRPRTRS